MKKLYLKFLHALFSNILIQTPGFIDRHYLDDPMWLLIWLCDE